MIVNLSEKLKSNSGESIAETLVALLIAALALLMLAGTINTASNLITNSSAKLDEYYKANNAIEVESESVGTYAVKVTVDGTAWINSNAKVYQNNVIGSTPVTAYRVVVSD